MTPADLRAHVRAAIQALAPVGKPQTGISIHGATLEVMAAAFVVDGARYLPYKRASTGDGYIRFAVDGILVAIHDVPSSVAITAGFTVQGRGGERRRR